MSRVFILLPVHNRKDETARFLECLRNQTHSNYQLILIDDGSSDGTADMVVSTLPSSVVLRGDGNLWWAGALQMGYDWLASIAAKPDDLVLIINDDTRFEENFLSTGVLLMGRHQHGMLHARCLDEATNEVLSDGVRVDWRRLTIGPVNDEQQTNCLSTRGLFMHLNDFLATGGFRPNLLPHYLSDFEFTIRAHRQGVRPILDSRLYLWTSRGEAVPVAGNGIIARLKQAFSAKNPSNPRAWLIFVLLCSPWQWVPFNLARVCARTLLRIVR